MVWIGWRACACGGGDARAARSYPAQTRGLELSGGGRGRGSGSGTGSGELWSQGLGVILWDVGEGEGEGVGLGQGRAGQRQSCRDTEPWARGGGGEGAWEKSNRGWMCRTVQQPAAAQA